MNSVQVTFSFISELNNFMFISSFHTGDLDFHVLTSQRDPCPYRGNAWFLFVLGP